MVVSWHYIIIFFLCVSYFLTIGQGIISEIVGKKADYLTGISFTHCANILVMEFLFFQAWNLFLSSGCCGAKCVFDSKIPACDQTSHQ